MNLEHFAERLQTGIDLSNMSKFDFAHKCVFQVSFLEQFLDGTKTNPTQSNMLRFSRALKTKPYFFYRPIQMNSAPFETIEELYLYESWLEIKEKGVALPEFEPGKTDPLPILLEKCTQLWQQDKIQKTEMLNLLGMHWSAYRKAASKHLKLKFA